MEPLVFDRKEDRRPISLFFVSVFYRIKRDHTMKNAQREGNIHHSTELHRGKKIEWYEDQDNEENGSIQSMDNVRSENDELWEVVSIFYFKKWENGRWSMNT